MPFLSFLGLGGSKRASQKANESAGIQRGAINSAFDRAEGFLSPIAESGSLARQLQLALSGALGPDAQAEAFRNYQDSPGVAFMRDQGLAGIERRAAANGTLQSGRTLADLSAFGTGIAQQDFGNQFNRLATLGNQGVNAAGNLANLATGRGTALANIEGRRGVAAQNAVIGQQNERVGLTQGLAQLGGFALGGGFNGAGQRFGGLFGGGRAISSGTGSRPLGGYY